MIDDNDGVPVVKLFETRERQMMNNELTQGVVSDDADIIAVLRRLGAKKVIMRDVCKHSTPEKLEAVPTQPRYADADGKLWDYNPETCQWDILIDNEQDLIDNEQDVG
jgi:hypothetical protein